MLETQNDYVEFIKDLHKDQVDNNGHPYYDHLLRVARYTQILFNPFDKGEANKENLFLTALLHDSVEDQGMTPTRLLHLGVPGLVVNAVCWVSRLPDFKGSYQEWIELLSARAPLLALKVKLADNVDNADPYRPWKGGTKPESKKERYYRAREALLFGLKSRFGVIPNMSYPSLYAKENSE